MKNLYILLITLLVFTYSNAQINFEKHIIYSSAEFPVDLCAGDFDNDGDLDLVGSTLGPDWVAWFKDTDSHQNFQLQTIISVSQTLPVEVDTGDLDGDNDIDIITVSKFHDQVVWYENFNDSNNFSNAKIIDNDLIGATYTQLVDINGDTFLDVVAVGWHKVVWYENINGTGDFGPKQIVNDALDKGRMSAVGDFDNDGDLDIASVSESDNTIQWYANLDGLGDFGGGQTLIHNTNEPTNIAIGDLDTDGDIDIVTMSYNSYSLKWFENLDGQGDYSEAIDLSNLVISGGVVEVADLDLDGDQDILVSAGSNTLEKLAYLENLNGTGSFSQPHIIEEGEYGIGSLVDLDLDGDIDILAMEYQEDTYFWLENQVILNTNSVENRIHVKLYPNPTQNVLNIESQQPIENFKIYNLQGQIIKEDSSNRVDVSQLTSGLYFVQVTIDEKTVTKKFLKE